MDRIPRALDAAADRARSRRLLRRGRRLPTAAGSHARWSLEWRRNRPELAACERILQAASSWERQATRVDDLRRAGAIDPLSPRPPAELAYYLLPIDKQAAMEARRRAHALAPGWVGTGSGALQHSSSRPAFEPPWEHGKGTYPHSAEQRAAARRLLNEALENAEMDFERARILDWLARMSDDAGEKRRILELVIGLDAGLMALAQAKVRLLELSETGARARR